MGVVGNTEARQPAKILTLEIKVLTLQTAPFYPVVVATWSVYSRKITNRYSIKIPRPRAPFHFPSRCIALLYIIYNYFCESHISIHGGKVSSRPCWRRDRRDVICWAPGVAPRSWKKYLRLAGSALVPECEATADPGRAPIFRKMKAPLVAASL